MDRLGIVGAAAESGAASVDDARGVRQRADLLDQRAMAGEGTEDDVLESLRLGAAGADLRRPAAAPPMPEETSGCRSPATASNADIGALLAGELPARAAAYAGPGGGAARSRESDAGCGGDPATASCFWQGCATWYWMLGYFPWMEQRPHFRRRRSTARPRGRALDVMGLHGSG